jgi:predicted MFS family arabinose efflux permease
VLGDYFGWRNVFFILALLLGIATAGLIYELMRNPITHASNAPQRPPRGYFADYATVLRSPWARMVIAMAFVEAGAMFGAYTYVGADLHLRFDLNFTLVGLVVGAFAIGGLIYSLLVHWLVDRLRQPGLAAGGGALLAAAYVTLAFEPTAWTAPLATVASGLGFYMLHNTLQTNATQMTPEARGTAVAIFSSALYLGQTAGVAAGGAVFDYFTAVPVFLTASAILLALGLWFARELKTRRA